MACAQEPDGTFNQQDEQGRKQGSWRKTNEEGKLVYEGQFLNDKPYGEFRYFYPTGGLRAKMIFSDTGDTAKTIHYHQNQMVQGEGMYIDQKKEGLWKFYNEAGILVSEENYKHDLRDGQMRSYYRRWLLT
jgi:antitoxin component YwqK of YwqJK toxin-antitoxin module